MNEYELQTDIEEIEENGSVFIKETVYKVYDNGSKEIACTVKYNKPEENPVYVPTDEELITAELLLNQADILARQNEQDEVLAEILLNQMGV